MLPKKIKSYSESFEKYKGGIKSLQWNSYKSAAKRFSQLINDINFQNKTILDVGCGFGDLIPFIFSRTSDFRYTGIDMMDIFVEEAQKRYPDFEFVTGDYFQKPLEKKFDIIFCCGALNGKSSDPIEDRKNKIKILFDNAEYAVAFNMAGGSEAVNSDGSKIYYAKSLEILNYCLTLTSKIIFKQHYHKKDFTIILFK